MASVCKWKQCKKMAKDDEEKMELLCCVNVTKCGNKIHRACLANLLSSFKESGDSTVVVCRKRCFNAVKKASRAADDPPIHLKKRVAWHNDDPTPSIHSVGCLFDWLTTGTNYSRYRGGDAQSDDTKTTIAGEVARFISKCGVTTTRTSKDVQSKISSLEQSFKAATDWLGATGQGVEDEKSLRDAILARCPYYYELYDVMNHRASTTPLVLNTDNLDSSEDSSDADESSSDTSTPSQSTPDSQTQRPPPTEASTSDSTTSQPTNGRKRGTSNPRSIRRSTKKTKDTIDELTASYPLADLKKKQIAQEREFQVANLQLEREKVAALAAKIEARVAEATARTRHFSAQAEACDMDRKINLLRERNKLRDEGAPLNEIEMLLPLLVSNLEEIVE